MAVFIVFLMAFSTFGFIYGFSSSNAQDKLKYKGQNFLPTQDGRWMTEINNVQFIFDYNPEQLVNMEIPSFDFGNKVYILFDPAQDEEYLVYNMQKLIYTLQATNRVVVSACDKEEGCPENVPIKTCKEDAVYIKAAEENKLYKDENCVVIEGDGEGVTQAVDKLDLELVGLR